MRGLSETSVRWRARGRLLHAQNCAQATLLTLEDVLDARFPGLVKAATNLEGGVVGCGSTCGVVTGGVLGIGAALARAGAGQDRILDLSREYVHWFGGRFGTTLCRERTRVDFTRAGGLARYLLSGTKLGLCLQHIGEALVFLSGRIREEAPAAVPAIGGDPPPCSVPEDPHCAGTVIRRLGGCGQEPPAGILGAASGFLGGVAGDGAACGALVGAFLALGLDQGLDVRAMNLAGITRAFVVGHVHLVQHERRARGTAAELPPEPFARTRFLADRFVGRFGSLHCAEITGRRFSSFREVRSHLCTGAGCREVFAWCVGEARGLALRPYATGGSPPGPG